MGCKCITDSKYHHDPQNTKKGIVLLIPDEIFNQINREVQTVTIDFCIAKIIKSLWAAGVVTLGCCCGHNKQNPNIIIPEGYGVPQIAHAKRLLSHIDSRTWDIFQWKLVSV